MPYLLILVLSLFAYLAMDDSDGSEKRDKIAIIDTGITLTEEIKPYLCKELKDATGTGIEDRVGHGTNIANIIKKGMNKRTQCLFIVKYFDRVEKVGSYSKALEYVLKEEGVKFVNMSLNGNNRDEYEEIVIRGLLNKGVIVSVAAGNSKEFLGNGCNSFPSCYGFNNTKFHVVGGIDVKSSNFGPFVRYWEMGNEITAGGITMTGTSQACAVHTSKLIKGR